MDVNLELYEVFVSLVENGSLSKTAHVRSITPSGVSQKIKSLEEQIGLKLFERQRKGLVITSAGKSLYANVKEHIKALEQTKNKMKNYNFENDKKVVVAGIWSLINLFFLKHIDIFKGFDVFVENHLRPRIEEIKGVEDGLIDFAIIKDYDQPKKNDLQVTKIGELNYVFFYNENLVDKNNLFDRQIVIKYAESNMRKGESKEFLQIIEKFENKILLGHDFMIVNSVKINGYVGFAPKEYLTDEFKIIDLGYTKKININLIYKTENKNAQMFLEHLKQIK